MREQLAILVSTSKAKEAISMQLKQDQVRRLGEKNVERYYKRNKTYVGAKTTENVVDSYLSLYIMEAAMFAPI